MPPVIHILLSRSFGTDAAVVLSLLPYLATFFRFASLSHAIVVFRTETLPLQDR